MWKNDLQDDLTQKERNTRKKKKKKVKLFKRQMNHFTLQSETHSFFFFFFTELNSHIFMLGISFSKHTVAVEI